MRPDMGKCVIERPRRGSRYEPSVKARAYGRFVTYDGELDYEGLTRLPVSRKGAIIMFHDSKDPSDVLGPLENYLRSSCGRPWNDVYSEIAYNLGRFTKQEGIRHIIKAHLRVATCTWRGVSGKIYYEDGNGVGEVGDYRGEFYVEPGTGILRSEGHYRKWYAPPVKHPERPVTAIPLSEGKEYKKIDGIWYYREYGMTSIKESYVIRGTTRYREEKVLVWEKKRQLGKKQLKALKLKNSAGPNG